MIGALVALGAVLLLARRHGAIDPVTLILGGVIVGAVASAGSTVAESLLPPERRGLLAGWLFGRIPDVPDPQVLVACAAAGLGLTALGAAWGPRLDAAALSDDEARSVGIALGPMRTAMFLGCGVATAATVVLCGPIAFVGLLAPHCARALVGPRSRMLVVGSAIAGAALLVGADALRQWIDVGGGRLPLGAVTAVLGGAAFLFLLRRTAAGWAR
jgi:iron complex transport system permease protein